MIRFLITSALVLASGSAGFVVGMKAGTDIGKLLCDARDALRGRSEVPSDNGEQSGETEESKP